jgi:hypothetical protein
MHAAVLHTLANPPRYEPFPDPVPGPDEAIVHVRAAAAPAVWRDGGADGGGTRALLAGAGSLDDATAAALPNPALSSWLPLTWRAQLAVRIAKLLGAGRVVAAGRNEQVLGTLRGLGADAAIHLEGSDRDVTQAFARAAGDAGYHVIVDYLWGHPTELLLAALTRAEFSLKPAGPRLIPIGESAGPAISLPAAALRSACRSPMSRTPGSVRHMAGGWCSSRSAGEDRHTVSPHRSAAPGTTDCEVAATFAMAIPPSKRAASRCPRLVPINAWTKSRPPE